jgi:glycine/sarcosine N-methyltransferase
MDPMTDTPDTVLRTEDFYDILAPEYDRMTDPAKRFIREKPYFHLLVEKGNIRTALDAGCGTGFHSLLLARLGVKVTAMDVSQKMLDQCGAQMRDAGMDVRMLRAGFLDIPASYSGLFDGVFCMGNSLPHLSGDEELSLALKRFYDVLRPGGMLFLQILNYDRILMRHDPPPTVRENGGTTYTRYTTFSGDELLFHIRTQRRRNGEEETSLQTVRLYPIRPARLVQLLDETGFGNIRLFGNISLEPFDPSESNDCIARGMKE